MSYSSVCKFVVVCLCAAMLAAPSGCPPILGPATFKLKFVNIGEHPVTAAYLLRVDQKADAEWGPNLLPFTLEAHEYVIFPQTYPKGASYDLFVEFGVDLDEDGFFDSAELSAGDGTGGMPTGGTDEFISWHAGCSGTPGGYRSTGTGYNWGLHEYLDEVDVTPAEWLK